MGPTIPTFKVAPNQLLAVHPCLESRYHRFDWILAPSVEVKLKPSKPIRQWSLLKGTGPDLKKPTDQDVWAIKMRQSYQVLVRPASSDNQRLSNRLFDFFSKFNTLNVDPYHRIWAHLGSKDSATQILDSIRVMDRARAHNPETIRSIIVERMEYAVEMGWRRYFLLPGMTPQDVIDHGDILFFGDWIRMTLLPFAKKIDLLKRFELNYDLSLSDFEWAEGTRSTMLWQLRREGEDLLAEVQEIIQNIWEILDQEKKGWWKWCEIWKNNTENPDTDQTRVVFTLEEWKFRIRRQIQHEISIQQGRLLLLGEKAEGLLGPEIKESHVMVSLDWNICAINEMYIQQLKQRILAHYFPGGFPEKERRVLRRVVEDIWNEEIHSFREIVRGDEKLLEWICSRGTDTLGPSIGPRHGVTELWRVGKDERPVSPM